MFNMYDEDKNRSAFGTAAAEFKLIIKRSWIYSLLNIFGLCYNVIVAFTGCVRGEGSLNVFENLT